MGLSRHRERHRSQIGGWLRAAVLGANDGIVSVASLVLGVAAASPEMSAVVTAGFAGLVGGALSMAVGEYVSVGSQRDVEEEDLGRERRELAEDEEGELRELAGLLQKRGVPEPLATQVAEAMTTHNALDAHAREELRLDPEDLARPMQAALVSAASFAVGASLPLLVMIVSPAGLRMGTTLGAALLALGLLGGWSARLGGAPVRRAVLRVVVGGAAAMGLTAGLGALFGVSVG